VGAEGEAHIYTNAAAASLEVLRMDEAEREMLEGTRHFSEGNAANPWLDLMDLYLGQGRMSEATSAVREALSWRRAQPAFMDDQTGAETEFGSALFLLVVGRGAEAARITGRILDRPDRTGFTSADSAQAETATALLSRAALRLAAERKAEEASWSHGWGRLRAWASSWDLRVQAWSSGRRASRRLTDADMLVATLRPYLPGGISVPVWLVGDLSDVLGAGVISAALTTARSREDLAEGVSYFDAFAAEAALRRGAPTEALALGQRALVSLPRPEVMLQARTAAVAGQAAMDTGNAAEAARLYAQALQLDPGVIRRLGLALPAVVGGAGGAAAREAIDALRRSPRLTPAHGGFSVGVAQMGTDLEICLRGPAGETVLCSRTPTKATEGPEVVAARAVEAFHERAFAPRVDLSQGDLQSLDGSTTVARERSARKIQGVIDAINGARPSPLAP
jgi:tetratricopeptide (TPR) repeat protein